MEHPLVLSRNGSERPGLSAVPFVEPDLADIEPYADASAEEMVAILDIRGAIVSRLFERKIAAALSERHAAEADGLQARIDQQDFQVELIEGLTDPPPPTRLRRLLWALRIVRCPMGPSRRERIQAQLLPPHKLREMRGRIAECRVRSQWDRERVTQYELEIMAYIYSLRRGSPQRLTG